MANATMQALQTHAEKLNQQVAEVNASIKALGDVPDDNPALLEYRKQLRRLNSDLKDVNTTMKDYTRGVKAAGELYRHYAMGNVEDMSIKAIRAGVNGMKKRLDNLKAGGDPGDAEEMRLIEAITTEADVVVKRFKTDYQHVVEEITRGGTVTEQTLKRTRDGLADLMQTAETEAEKNELTNYWQKVGAAIEAVAVENRRLRGEVADREEAMRIAYVTDHDGSQQSIRDAEARADAARRENDELRQRLDLKQQQRRELEQEMDINSMQQRALMDQRDELKAQEKENRAIRNQRVDDANKEVNAARRAAKTQQQAYDEQKQTVEKLRTEVQGLTAAQVQSSEQLAQKQEQLSQKTAELNQQQDKLNGMVDETVTANQRLAKAEQEQTDARNAQAEANKHKGEAVKKVEDELRGLTDEQLKNAQAYSHLTEEINTDTAAMQRNITTEQEATREADRLRSGSIDKMEQALARLRESNRKLDPTIDKEEWERGERAIGQLNLRLEELKKQSAELRREPVLDMMTQRMDQLGTLSRDALQETKKFWQAMYDGAENDADKLREIEDNLKRINTEEQKRDRKTLEERAARLQNVENYSVGELREGIEAAKMLQDQYHLTDDELQQLSVNIVAAETRIAKVGVEAERQAQKQREQIELMEQQLSNGSALTESALKAQVNYWQRLADDPKAAAEAVKQYTANMERAQSLLDVKERVDIRIKAGRLDNMDGYSVSELREGIDAAKKMQDTFRLSNDEVQQLSEKIVAAEVRISQFSVESERQAQRQREQIALMEQQLANGSALTESALKAQVNYWQRLADAPKAAAEAVAQYTANMKQAQDLLDQSQRADIESKAGRLQNLGAYSISEIREGIDAAKKMQQTFHLTDAEVQELSEDIVAAEKHVSQFSVENERAAQKQREQIELMEEQLRRGTGLTETALKQQESYWRRLADDPKAAANEIARYFENLNKVHAIQKEKAESQTTAYGLNALKFFRGDTSNASADQIKEQAKALKAYRDSLPSKDRADVIAEIDGYLKAAGVSAKKAAEDVMDLKDALDLAEKAGDSKQPFNYSAQEIQQATKALELRREELIKQIRAERDLGNAVDAQEKELDDLTKKLRSLKFEQDNVNMSQEKMRTLIETPANAVNLDELRAAIKRADGQLRQMQQSLGQNSDEYKRFAEQVRNAKNVMKEMEGQAKASATAWEKAFSRLKTYVVMYMGFNEVWQKVSNTARDLMDLSDRMGEVRKTTGFTADEVGRLSENLKKMDVRTSLTSLMEISASAGQLGLKTLEDVQGFTEAANKLMIALPEMGREAATEMMRVAIATGEVDKIRKQLQEGTIEGSSATAVAMEKIASTIDRLRASSASTAPEITDFVKRVGAVGAQSGITIDQVAALGSTVSSLGMRVEMSATALSRMIPAIRRNAFDVAHAIGMAPEALRKMFDEAGGGMNAMLEIFQHIKDAGMDENDIEKMLGMGDMAEIMKELNQQGARAGIVFAGLSQNVDELRRQLGVANQAYDENIAIQQEFDKMNETTAAKWERLKNAFEEMFVGDEAQRGLGVLIDGLRKAVDLINDLQGYIVRIAAAFALWKTGVGGAIWTYLINPIRLAVTGVHSLDFQVKGFAVTWRTAWKSMDAATKANWIAALASAFYMLGKYIYDTATRVSELQQELNRLDIETDDAVSHVGRLVTAFNDSSVKAEAAAKKQADLQAQTDRLSKEVDKLKKSTDEGAASTDELKRKQAELEEKEKELKKATDESNKANQARSNLISEMNSKYSTYLGYMLNEKTAAEQVASAHQLIVAALKEERKQKGLNALHDAVDKEYADDIKEYSENSQEELSGIARDAQRRIMDQWRRVLTAVTPDAKTGNFTLAAVDGVTKGGTYGSEAELKAAMRSALRDIVRTEAGGKNDRVKVSTWAGTKYKSLDDYLDDIWGGGSDDGFGNWAETYINRERDIAKATHDNQVEVNQAHKERIEAAVKDQRTNLENLQKLAKDNNQFTDDQIRQMAQDVNALVAGFDHFGEELSGADEIFGKGQERTLQNAVNNVLASLDQKTRGRVFRVAQKGQKSTNGTGSVPVPSGSNAWGSNAPADSTDYSLFDVNELVARRNQMDKFKNILKPDTDVRTVLAEDKALMKALDNGLKSDWKSVLDWYNAERKKIQEELKSERFSTNTGHWRDEKNGRGRRNRFRESDYALAELDRYYSRRKEKLEKAREEEGMSEELFNREAELLEQEHLERRSKLRETFTAGTSKQEQEMVKQFRLWWDKLEKGGDLDEVPWATVEREWTQALASEIGRNNLKAQQDLTQLQSITVKHLNAIAKLIDQERPYDGITANLRKNLTEMDILLADMVKDGPAEDTAKLVSEQGKRLQFLLTEAEHAYALTFDDLAKKMREQGLGDWADALMIDEQKKQSLMQNLRNVYDQIQEAIKKEASIIKKQLEIQWNDMLPGQDMSMKGTFEKAISDLGLAGDQVKRANSLIGAGAASERVVDRLAIQQMKVQLAMQQTYFALMQKIGDERVRQLRLSAEANEHDAKALKAKAEQLRKEGKITEAETKEREAEIAARQALQDSFDAEHAQKSLNLAKTKEIAEEEKQRVAIQNQLEESQNRLYSELRSWADLLTSSLQGVMEASHAGDAEYYNERAKLELTGKGGPGAGTYVVIDDAGTSDATAHYEYLDERQALERQHEIERENAMAEAWEKLWDDINMKMSDQITDWVNASLQDAAVKDNTDALLENTRAIYESMGIETGEPKLGQPDALPSQPQPDKPSAAVESIVIPSGSTNTEAPKIVGTDPENTSATNANTAALNTLTQVITGQSVAGSTGMDAATAGTETTATVEGDMSLQKPFFQMSAEETAAAMETIRQMWQTYNEGGVEALQMMAEELAAMEGIVLPPWQVTEEGMATAMERMGALWQSYAEQGIAAMQQMSDEMAEMPNKIPDPTHLTEEHAEQAVQNATTMYQGLGEVQVQAQQAVTDKVVEDNKQQEQSTKQKNKQQEQSTKSTYSAMTAAMNMYGTAYQIMSNDNMDMTQKFQMFALQAAGQTAIGMLTTNMLATDAQGKVELPGILGKAASQLGPIAGPIAFAAMSALLGGLMAVAMSSVNKSKSQIAQVTGASVGAGRLAAGMLTYAGGNVNELTDPASLTPGRQYNVDGADGKTYRARYMGKEAKTHITNGPEFHLVGEAGREAIIDAKTTRLLQMNETGIWRDIQTLYNGGSISGLSTRRRRGTGVRAFADGNIGEFGEMADGGGLTADGGADMGFDPAALQASLDRNSEVQELLLERLQHPLTVAGTGPNGVVAMYDKLKKEAQRHGEKYI